MRRGYKVDEVDSFLDRVEATLSGDPMGAPVSAQEVHDVVFRVRFGGYDEWQGDLHLDRVERQVAHPEEGGGFAPARHPRPAPMREDRFAALREEQRQGQSMPMRPVGASMPGGPMGGPPPLGAPAMAQMQGLHDALPISVVAVS